MTSRDLAFSGRAGERSEPDKQQKRSEASRNQPIFGVCDTVGHANKRVLRPQDATVKVFFRSLAMRAHRRRPPWAPAA